MQADDDPLSKVLPSPESPARPGGGEGEGVGRGGRGGASLRRLQGEGLVAVFMTTSKPSAKEVNIGIMGLGFDIKAC